MFIIQLNLCHTHQKHLLIIQVPICNHHLVQIIRRVNSFLIKHLRQPHVPILVLLVIKLEILLAATLFFMPTLYLASVPPVAAISSLVDLCLHLLIGVMEGDRVEEALLHGLAIERLPSGDIVV